jgi:gamma-glutamyltranspeptidase/glutathione hydrolase
MDRSRNSRSGLVVAPQAEAAYAGAQVLAEGGGAADAAVTAALVQGVVDPHRSGIGGFGCATLFVPRAGPQGGSLSLAVDFHGRAGRQSRAEQWEKSYEGAAPDGFGYLVRGKVNDVGYASITTPGTVAGLEAIHRRFGRLPWRDLVLRAVPWAEEGFLVTPSLAEFWVRPGLFGRVSTRDRLTHTEEGRRVALKEDGETYRAGEVFKQPALARTYRRLAAEGPESFYRGGIAAEIARDWEAHGALLGSEDLASYEADVHPPLKASYRGFTILSTPLPGGGVALLQTLRLLEAYDLASLEHNSPDYVDVLAPVFQRIWADRLSEHADPRFGGLSEAELLSPSYLRSLSTAARVTTGADSESTTQLTIVDGDGCSISLSHSLGYGSGVFTNGMGFMYNNCMSAFDPRSGRRNSIAPGKARNTAVAETIVLDGEAPVLVLGSPGASRITAALAQVIINVIDFGMTAGEAVVMPRFDAYGERELVLESRFPLPVVSELAQRGWRPKQSAKPFGVVGRVYAIGLDPSGGRPPVAGVDPGEPGAAFRA